MNKALAVLWQWIEKERKKLLHILAKIKSTVMVFTCGDRGYPTVGSEYKTAFEWFIVAKDINTIVLVILHKKPIVFWVIETLWII